MRMNELLERIRRGEILMEHQRGGATYTIFTAIRREERVYPIICTINPGLPAKIDMFDADIMKYAILENRELENEIKPVREFAHIFIDACGFYDQMIDALDELDESFDFVIGFRENDFYMYAGSSKVSEDIS